MYTVYKTTNLVDGKFYIGVHKTNNPMDDYVGSGKHIKRAIAKHGLENFQKVIVAEFETAADAFLLESQLVTEREVADKNCYNLKVGGQGGWDYLNSDNNDNLSNKRKAAHVTNSRYKNDPCYQQWHSRGGSVNFLKNGLSQSFSDARKLSMLGKIHTSETKSKMSAAAKLRTGSKNSSFGSFWITNGVESKKTRGDVPDGWKRGRK